MAVPIDTHTPSQASAVVPARTLAARGDGPRRWMRPGPIATYGALIVLSVVFCLPFVWLVLSSLKPADEIYAGTWLPSRWMWSNYSDVFAAAPVLDWFLNTLLVTTLAVVAVVMSSSLVAYAFARIRFPGKRPLFALVMGTYLLPGAVTLIPTFIIWNRLGAVNTFWPLWAGNLFGSAFYIFMLRQFMLTIPQDLVDAARVDGAGFFRIYWSLMLPLVRPALVAVAIFEANAKWDDFMTPLIYLNNPDSYTFALGLASMKDSFKELGTQWSLLMAASVIFTVPMMILFFLFQRYFMEGVTHSGIKG
ncbi:MAG TPA: carbohydrate ABC transporter permease [Thermomicrobiales bacterium]|nr:carbohydrate ABC transporter permease [Thermomicrobiales bacterium]